LIDNMEWTPTGSPVAELCRMLELVRWGEPLEGYQAQCLRECALWVRDGRTDNPLRRTITEDRLLLDLTDALLPWVDAPQDSWLTDRVKAALADWLDYDETW
jgi:hypothetical protein